MANKPTKPNFPLGLESQDQSVFQEGILNNGVVEHGPDAVMTVPETPDASGVPSAVRYNEDDDQFEGYYNEGGWLPLGGGNGGRWEALPHASSSLLQAGRAYLVDNTDGVSTVLFPSPKRIGDSVTVCDLYGKFSTYPLTVDGNGKSIYGSADSMTISTDNVSATFTWTGEARGWVITSGVGLGQGRVYSREIYSQILSATTPSITLSTQPSIVDVYVDGKRLKESLYTLDGYEVKFDPALASGSDVQIIQYIPIQLGAGGGGSGGTVITWEYNGGSAIGGETQIVLDVVVDSVSEIYIRGSRQQIGRGFTFDPATSTITLADELEAGDDVVVVINGDPTVYNQIDRTPWEVARANNVSNSEVILSTDKTSVLDGKTIIYDVLEQKAWGIPSGIPSGAKISNVSSGVLIYTPGNVSKNLIELMCKKNIRELWRRTLIEFGVNLVAGSFEEGAVLNNSNDAIWYFSGGQCYFYSGNFPKVIEPNSYPGEGFSVVQTQDDLDIGGEGSSLFDRLTQRGQYDLHQGFADPRGIAGITFGGKNNKGTITVDQRGRLQVYSVKDGVLTASRVAIPFTEGYGYGSNSKLGTITRFPVAGAEDDSQNSSLILLPQDDGSVKGYLAGPGLYTAYAVPESNAVKSLGKEIATIDQLPEALIFSSSNPTTWLSTSSWVKLVTVNNSQQGAVFSGLYSAGGGLSEAVGNYLIEMFSPSTNITTINSANLKTFVRITALRSRGDFRYPSGLCSFGIVVDSTAGTTTLYAKLSNRSENSTLVPLRTTPDSSTGVFRVKIWNDKDSYVTVEPSGIIYTQIAESLTSNTTVTLNDGSCATTRGAVVRIANSMSSVTKSTIVGSEFQSNDTYSAINRGYAGLGTVTVTKPSTGKYVITGAKTPDNAEWKIRSPMTAFGGGLQTLVATIESEVGNVITIGVRSVNYTANTTTGAVTVALGDYTDIPNDSWVDVHTNLN